MALKSRFAVGLPGARGRWNEGREPGFDVLAARKRKKTGFVSFFVDNASC
jgi:hypothetical protein